MAARTGDGSQYHAYSPDTEGLAAALKDHFTPALTAMRAEAAQGRLVNRSATIQFNGATWTVSYRPDWKENQVVGYIISVDQDVRGGYTTEDVACAEATITELGF
jgi:hypothetical protein